MKIYPHRWHIEYIFTCKTIMIEILTNTETKWHAYNFLKNELNGSRDGIWMHKG